MRHGRSVAQQEQVRRSGRVLSVLKSPQRLIHPFNRKGHGHEEKQDLKKTQSSPVSKIYLLRGADGSKVARTSRDQQLLCSTATEDTPQSIPGAQQRIFLGNRKHRKNWNEIKQGEDGESGKVPRKMALFRDDPSTDPKQSSSSDARFLSSSSSAAKKHQHTPTLSDVFSSDDDGDSDDDDDDGDGSGGDSGSGQRRKFYIVTNGKRPAEMYRTDLNHFKKYDDSSSDEEALMARITDRWKEGWTHVQVPISNKWPEFVVATEPSSSKSSPSTSAKPKPLRRPRRPRFHESEKRVAIHHASRYVDDTTFVRCEMPPLISYPCDRLDGIFLSKMNERRKQIGLPPIPGPVFARLMEHFEVETYKGIHRDLLAPLMSTSSPLDVEHDEDATCDICRQGDYDDDDEIIFCDGCNLSVHQSCYGLDSVPNDEWLCNACTLLGYKAQPRCALCPLMGGAMKCMKGGQIWAHIVCALWIPEVRFGDVDHREAISNISDVPAERWALRCSVCDTKQGACIQCSMKSCTTAFHVTCGLRNEQEMKIEHDATVDDGVRMVSLCEKHSLPDNSSSIAGKSDSSPERSVKCPKSQEELRRMEESFYLYVSPDEVAKETQIAVEMVDDVYEYWKMKRLDNAGRALLDDVCAIDINLSASSSHLLNNNNSASSVLSMRVQNEMKLRQNLEKARNLCYMVSRREKYKKKIIECFEETFTFIKNALDTTALPTSSRTLDRYCEAVSICIKTNGSEVPFTPPPPLSPPTTVPSSRSSRTSRSSITPSVERSSTSASTSTLAHRADSPAAPSLGVSVREPLSMIITKPHCSSGGLPSPSGLDKLGGIITSTTLQDGGGALEVSAPPSPKSKRKPETLKSQNRKPSNRNSLASQRPPSSPQNHPACTPQQPRSPPIKQSAQKIRERNGPDSPRRLPSKRMSAIKANISLDLAAHYPYYYCLSKRSSLL